MERSFLCRHFHPKGWHSSALNCRSKGLGSGRGRLLAGAKVNIFGDTQGALFAAVQDQNAIYKFSQDDISQAGAYGKVLVTSETGQGIGVISVNGNSYNVAPFDPTLTMSFEGAVVGCEKAAPTAKPTAVTAPRSAAPSAAARH